MADKKPKIFCRIPDYLDHVDSELASVLDNLCMRSNFGVPKFKSGVTFLWPQDKSLKDKIIKLAYSSDISEYNKASDLLCSLIIQDNLKTAGDWAAHKDDLPNSLSPAQHTEITSASGKEVAFKNGAKAVLDTGFIDGSKRQNMSVWKLSGELPITTDKPATMKYARVAKKVGDKKGGYSVSNLVDQNERFKIMVAIENEYLISVIQARQRGSPSECVFHKTAMSLIEYLFSRELVDLIGDSLLPIMDFGRTDIYLLLEPHKTNGMYLIDNELIHDWWLNKNANPDCRNIRHRLNEMLMSYDSPAMIYKNRDGIRSAVAEVRSKIIGILSSKARIAPEEIAKYYKQLEESNTIGDVGPIYPKGVAQLYSSEPGLKLIHDELRFVMNTALDRFESCGQISIQDFDVFTNLIGDYLHTNSAQERASMLKILNTDTIKWQIMPDVKLADILIFVNSTALLYTPMTEEEARRAYPKCTPNKPTPGTMLLWNIAKGLYEKHDRVESVTDSSRNTDLIKMLSSLDVTKLDPALAEIIRKKFDA